MNKKLETLHKQLVANQKKINNSSRNERIKKLKILKKNILEYTDEIKLALKKDFKKKPYRSWFNWDISSDLRDKPYN